MTYSGKQVLVEKEELDALREVATQAIKWKNWGMRPGFQALKEAVELIKTIDNYEFVMKFMPDPRILRRARQIPDNITFDDENGEPLKEWGTVTLEWEQKLFIAAKSILWKQSLPTTLIRILTTTMKEMDREHAKA